MIKYLFLAASVLSTGYAFCGDGSYSKKLIALCESLDIQQGEMDLLNAQEEELANARAERLRNQIIQQTEQLHATFESLADNPDLQPASLQNNILGKAILAKFRRLPVRRKLIF